MCWQPFEQAELIFRDVCVEMCSCEYQRGGRSPTAHAAAAQGLQCFAYRDTCSAHIFGFVVVDVNYNAGFVIPVSE